VCFLEAADLERLPKTADELMHFRKAYFIAEERERKKAT
jgi:hypothetical protein